MVRRIKPNDQRQLPLHAIAHSPGLLLHIVKRARETQHRTLNANIVDLIHDLTRGGGEAGGDDLANQSSFSKDVRPHPRVCQELRHHFIQLAKGGAQVGHLFDKIGDVLKLVVDAGEEVDEGALQKVARAIHVQVRLGNVPEVAEVDAARACLIVVRPSEEQGGDLFETPPLRQVDEEEPSEEQLAKTLPSLHGLVDARTRPLLHGDHRKVEKLADQVGHLATLQVRRADDQNLATIIAAMAHVLVLQDLRRESQCADRFAVHGSGSPHIGTGSPQELANLLLQQRAVNPVRSACLQHSHRLVDGNEVRS